MTPQRSWTICSKPAVLQALSTRATAFRSFTDRRSTSYNDQILRILSTHHTATTLTAPLGTEKASDKIEEKPQDRGCGNNTETNGKTITLYSHMNGTAVKLEDVEDDVFSQKILGEGAAVEPSEGEL